MEIRIFEINLQKLSMPLLQHIVLKKQKVALLLRRQDEWEEYFNENRTACQTLANQITGTDHQIDRMVYALYGLT